LCIAVFLNFVSSQQDAIQAGKGDKFLSPTICNVTHLLHTKELYKSKLEKRKKEELMAFTSIFLLHRPNAMPQFCGQ